MSPSFRGCCLSPVVCLLSFLLSPCYLVCLLGLTVSAPPVWLLSPFLSLHLSSSMSALSFTLFQFVSLCRPLLAGFVSALWWRMGSWSSLFTTTLVLHFSEFVSSGCWCPSSFGICLPFVPTNLPVGTLSFLCLLLAGSGILVIVHLSPQFRPCSCLLTVTCLLIVTCLVVSLLRMIII